MTHGVVKIISGGQTGADRGGLDAAIALRLKYGGWVPKGRLAEDGQIPAKYKNMREAASTAYPVRTALNVRESDATLIFYSVARGLGAGSKLTDKLAIFHKKPCALIGLCAPLRVDLTTVDVIRGFLAEHKPRVLNVAGTRESYAPGICNVVCDTLVAALSLR